MEFHPRNMARLQFTPDPATWAVPAGQIARRCLVIPPTDARRGMACNPPLVGSSRYREWPVGTGQSTYVPRAAGEKGM